MGWMEALPLAKSLDKPFAGKPTTALVGLANHVFVCNANKK